MDKFREKYIALQKAFWDTDGGAASILALYEFKDELEKCVEKEAKLGRAILRFVSSRERASASQRAGFPSGSMRGLAASSDTASRIPRHAASFSLSSSVRRAESSSLSGGSSLAASSDTMRALA